MATINEIVANDFRQKMRLERIFTPEVKSIFTRTARNFRVSVAATGSPQQVRPGVWQSAIEKQYGRVQKAFQGEVVAQQKAMNTGWMIRKAVELKQAELTTEEAAQLQLALLTWSDFNSDVSSKQITNTTEQNMVDAIRQARTVIIEQELPDDNATLAAIATRILIRKFRGRVSAITSSETQSSAEATKLMEAETLSGLTPFALVPGALRGQEGPREITDSTKRWVTVGDNRVRDLHKRANGQIRNLEQPYDVNGEQLRSPGDRSLGASAGNIINCLHPTSKIWAAEPEALTRRWYDGEMITLKTHSGKELTITPNHPILCGSGWVPADVIKEGHGIISTDFKKWSGLGTLDIENVAPTVEQMYNSFSVHGVVVRVPGVDVDFHGEIPDHDVDIVSIDGVLGYGNLPPLSHPFKKLRLSHPDLFAGSTFAHGLISKNRICDNSASRAFMRCFYLMGSLFISHARPLKSFCLALTPYFNPSISDDFVNGRSANTSLFMNAINRFTRMIKVDNARSYCRVSFHKCVPSRFRLASYVWFDNSVDFSKSQVQFIANLFKGKSVKVQLDNVVSVHKAPYKGYVYNLEDKKSYYISNGIVNHNCRCSSVFRVA